MKFEITKDDLYLDDKIKKKPDEEYGKIPVDVTIRWLMAIEKYEPTCPLSCFGMTCESEGASCEEFEIRFLERLGKYSKKIAVKDSEGEEHIIVVSEAVITAIELSFDTLCCGTAEMDGALDSCLYYLGHCTLDELELPNNIENIYIEGFGWCTPNVYVLQNPHKDVIEYALDHDTFIIDIEHEEYESDDDPAYRRLFMKFVKSDQEDPELVALIKNKLFPSKENEKGLEEDPDDFDEDDEDEDDEEDSDDE